MAATPQTEALEECLRENGGFLHPSIRIVQNREAGVHWRAEGAAIESGTVVSTVPHSLALSYLNALVDDAYPVFKQRRHDFKVEAIGFFYLVTQYINKNQSFWRPYLETLPRPEDGFATPLWFDDPADVKWLEGTDVLHSARARREVYEQYYHCGIRVLRGAGIDVTPYTWDLFRWAVTIFTSRSFSSRAITPQESKYWTTYKTGADGRRQTVLLDMSHAPAEDLDFPVLFPIQDAPNHSHEAHVDWTFAPGRFSVSVNDRTEAGDEVFNNYGAKGNDEFLLGYGFCTPHNPHDIVILTLKPPPKELQEQLQRLHPGYFTTLGHWNSERATFGIKKPPESAYQDPEIIFHSLPGPLFELLLYILCHERGLPFRFYESPVEFLTKDTNGRRYLPHIAKMIVQSLTPKLAKLQAVELPTPRPQNEKQRYASIYRDSQIALLQSNIAVLRGFTRSFLKVPSAHGPRFVTLEGLLELWSAQTSPANARPFIAGLEACSGTADVDQLREAGWEEDAFVLLLSYIFLDATRAGTGTHLESIAETDSAIRPVSTAPHETRDGRSTWVEELLPEYTDPFLSPRPAAAEPIDADALGHVQSILELVDTAKQLPDSQLWADGRWSERLIVGFGRMLQFESMMMMVPRPASAASGVGGSSIGEEARLVVYIHSSQES